MATPTSLDQECFFIAPIGSDDSPERKRSDGVLQFIVSRAAEELGLQAVRADQIAVPGQITLQVIDHVLGAKASVVDLTGLNANVFYELAVRHTARLPVALICDKETKLPFDIAQMRTIFFDHTDLASADECRQQIVAQLREAIEGGSVDSPIATAIDVQTMQAGNPIERGLADVLTTLEDIGISQRELLERVSRRGADVSPGAVRDLLERVDYLEFLHMSADAVDDSDLTVAITRVREVAEYLAHAVGARGGTARRHSPSGRARNARGLTGEELAKLLPDEVVAPDHGGGVPNPPNPNDA